MDYKCTELQGATYQPKDSLKFNDYWIIPAWKNASVWQTTDSKLVFVAEEKVANTEDLVYFFVLCYQFIFLHSDIYHFYNSWLNPKVFTENGQNFNEIEQKIRIRYSSSDVGCLAPDFNQIDIFHTGLPHSVNFKYIHDHFVELYQKDMKFKNIITLFLDTVGTKHRLYDNIFQQISQLQIIFETILGVPATTKCDACGTDRYVETWTEFQKKRLKEIGIEDDESIELFSKIKTTLNTVARVKYIHRSLSLNPWSKYLQELTDGRHKDGKSEYSSDLKHILSIESDKWTAVDWNNIYYAYQHFVKLLIYFEYFTQNQPSSGIVPIGAF